MARIRSLHPGQWTDEDFVSCSYPARLLVLALRNMADDQGVFEWKPVQIKMQALPADMLEVVPLLEELERHHQIRRFEVAGKSYGAIRNFRKWQRPEKPKNVHPLPTDLRPYVGLPSGSGDTSAMAPPAEEQHSTTEAAGSSAHSSTIRRPVGDELSNCSAEEGGRRKEVEEPLYAPLAGKPDAPPMASPPPKADARGTRLPKDWQPGSAEVAFAQGLGLEVKTTAARFSDYWTAIPGTRGRKADWLATWRTWCRKDAEDPRRPTTPPHRPGQSYAGCL